MPERRGIGGEPIRPDTLAVMERMQRFATNMSPRQREILVWLSEHEDDGEGELVQQGLVAHLGSGYNPVAARTVAALLYVGAIHPMPGLNDDEDYHIYVITSEGKAMAKGTIPPDSQWR